MIGNGLKGSGELQLCRDDASLRELQKKWREVEGSGGADKQACGLFRFMVPRLL